MLCPADRRGHYALNLETNVRAIEALGAASTILATDAGQMENPPWDECWECTLHFFRSSGIGEVDLATMCTRNSAALLELRP